jgi:hypothetical protein
MALQYDALAAHHPVAIRARGLRQLAAEIQALHGATPLLHVHDNSALQFYLHTMNIRVSPEAAADALAGAHPILVATSTETDELDQALAARGLDPKTVASWSDESGWGVRVLANEAATKAIAR